MDTPESTALMQALDGEVREVPAPSEELVRLMVAGWKQITRPAEPEEEN